MPRTKLISHRMERNVDNNTMFYVYNGRPKCVGHGNFGRVLPVREKREMRKPLDHANLLSYYTLVWQRFPC